MKQMKDASITENRQEAGLPARHFFTDLMNSWTSGTRGLRRIRLTVRLGYASVRSRGT